jgi:hypothetical protein
MITFQRKKDSYSWSWSLLKLQREDVRQDVREFKKFCQQWSDYIDIRKN